MKPIMMTVQWLLLEDMFQQTFNKISLIWKKCDWVLENMGIHIFGKNCCCPNETITEKTNW